MAAPGPIQTEYMRRMRVARAQSLLSCPDLEVSDIALASGLCDQSHFTNVFRRVHGQAAAALSPADCWKKPAKQRGTSLVLA